MNVTGKTIFLILFCSLLSVSAWAKMDLHQPPVASADWSIDLELELSKDLYCKFMKVEEADCEDCYGCNKVEFKLDHEGCLESIPGHPLITGKIVEDKDDTSLPAAYLPQKELQRSYKQAFEILKQFDFEDSPRSTWTDSDVSGIDIDFRFSMNGRTVYLSYGKFKTIESLPGEVIEMLSIFRRSLPAEYDRLFDFLKVPKLPSLSKEDQQHIRKCPVHKEWMKVEKVRLVHIDGYTAGDYRQAQNTLFPNSEFFYLGGGFGGSEQTHALVLYCPACRKAEKKWFKDQGEDFDEFLAELIQENTLDDF